MEKTIRRPMVCAVGACFALKDAPEPRPVQGPEEGKFVAFPQMGGLHHRYERLAA